MKGVVGLLLFLLHQCILAQQPKLVLPVGHTSSVSSALFSPDEKYIVTASWDNTAKIWQAEDGRLMHELKGHSASLTYACFSPDGKFIVTASKDSTARLWKASNGEFVREFRAHRDWISAASFSSDNKFLVIGSWDNTATVWDLASGRQLYRLSKHSGPITSVAYSQNGKYILTSSIDSTAIISNAVDGKLVQKLRGHGDWVNHAAFSPNGKIVATASNDGSARLWDITTGKVISVLSKHEAGINTVAFSNDGKFLLTASKDFTAGLWQAADGKLLHQLTGHEASVNTAQFSQDGKWIVSGSDDNTAKLWQTADGKLFGDLRGHEGPLTSCTFNKDGRYLLTSSTDNSSKVWEIPSQKLTADLKGHTSVVTSAIYSDDGKYMVTASWDHTAKIWDARDGKLLSNLKGHTHWINSAAFSADGRYVVTTSSDSTARIWSVPNGILMAQLIGHQDWVSSASFNSDASLVVTTSWDSTARVWKVSSGELVSELKGHKDMVKSAVFSADGKSVLTASWDKTARLWNAMNGNQILNLTGHTEKVRTAVFSPGDKYVLTASWDSTARLWSADGKLIQTLRGHKGSLNAAFFSHDGKYIATTSMDHSSMIWNSETGKMIVALKGHQNVINSAAFSQDGKLLVTASWDKTARIWQIPSGKLVGELKGHTGSLKSVAWSPDNNLIVTTSEDNTIKTWNGQTGAFLYTFFSVDSTGFLVIDKDGRYDGTEAARKMLYYVCGSEIADLEQFKDLSWEPGLVGKLTGMNHEPVTAKRISDIEICNYTPMVRDNGVVSGKHKFTITGRRGGVGEVQVYVNNKLVEKYDTSQLQRSGSSFILNVDPDKVKDFFVSESENTLSVKATTAGGTMLSRGVTVSASAAKKLKSNPDLYLISIGISKYKEEKLSLKYAAKDAIDFSSVLSASAERLLNSDGKQHVFSYSLNTDDVNARWPVKEGIEKLIDSIAIKASPDDILVLFFAGHGILQTGQKDFYLLTADATSFELDGVEKHVAISTEELKDWLRKIKASKQVLILDACNSGQVVQNFQEFVGKREVPADQQRALESLKDKTGTFILCASASGQSAYETSLYMQGLLTYSLLSGIKLGGGLKENKYIDVTKWFNYTVDYVKQLAKEIGGRQDPQLIGNASFQIGMVDRQLVDNIQLSLKKKIFRRSVCIQDLELLNDELDMSRLIDNELTELSEKGRLSPLLFVADNTLADTYSVSGRYGIENSDIIFKGSVLEGQKKRVFQFEVKGNILKKEELAKNIVNKIQEFLNRTSP